MSRLTLVVVASSLLAACSLITSLDGLGSQTTSDGAPPADATQETIANDTGTGTDAGTGNLVPNPSFDDGQGGCGPSWGNGYGMTYTRVSPGRTGPYACEVCIQGSSSSYALSSLVQIPVDAGSYYAEAWLMTPDGGIAEQNGVGVLIGYDIDAGISSCIGTPGYCQGSISTPPSTWAKSSASFVSNGPGTATVEIHTYGGTAGSCVIVDDVAFYAQ